MNNPKEQTVSYKRVEKFSSDKEKPESLNCTEYDNPVKEDFKDILEKLDFDGKESEKMMQIPEKSRIINNYKIIDIIYRTCETSIFLAEDIDTEEKFVLKRTRKDTIEDLYQKAIKDCTEKKKSSSDMEKKALTPAILEFFTDGSFFYSVLEYKKGFDTKELSLYTSTGKILNNRYIVLRGIASGSRSVIYLAHDLFPPGDYLVIKEIINKKSWEKEDIKDRFKNEAKKLINLNHPNLVRSSDFFMENNRLYLVMEYVEGISLWEKIRKLKKDEYFSEEQIINWALDICDVMDYLHNQPDNLLFSMPEIESIIINSEGKLKLIDSGIAKNLAINKNFSRNDIYYLGIILYCLVTGTQIKREKHFLPLENFNPSVSGHLKEIIYRAIKSEIIDGFESTGEIKEELTKLYNSKKVKVYISNAKEYENRGDFLRANFEYTKALELKEDNYEILLSIARCYEKMGLFETASGYYGKLLKLHIPEGLRRKILAKLHIINKRMEEEGFSEKKVYNEDINYDIKLDRGDDVRGSLLYYSPDRRKVSLPLYDITGIGRAKDNDLILDYDRDVSGKHSRIIYEKGSFFIEDLGSTNGTFINDRRINSKLELKHNDKIGIGSVHFVFIETNPKKEVSSPPSVTNAPEPAKLVYCKYGRRKISCPLNKDLITIGRAGDNDVVLEFDLEISGRHAKIIKEDVKYIIEDLGSTNGTFVNGSRINSPVTLKHKDKIRTGYVKFTFLNPQGKYTEPLSAFLF